MTGRVGRLLMNLLLLQAGFPIVVISNGVWQAYIEAFVVAQLGEQELDGLLELVLAGARVSLVEMLRVVVTAGEGRGKALAFYEETLVGLEA